MSKKAVELQTFIFKKDESPPDVNGGDGWTESTARSWLLDHDFKAPKAEETENSWRFRQFEPDLCELGSYRTLTRNFPVGVIAISCQTSKGYVPEVKAMANRINHAGYLKAMTADMQACIDACAACASACEYCASQCLSSTNVSELSACIKLCLDCANICRTCCTSMAQGSEDAMTICMACAAACAACATECEKYADLDHCVACAKACRICVTKCNAMIESDDAEDDSDKSAPAYIRSAPRSVNDVELKHMTVPMSLKDVSSAGKVGGYASIFGNIDLGGDVIAKDMPFKEFVTNPDGKVVMLFQHDSGMGMASTGAGGLPIGSADIEQNSKGLKFDGQLVMEDPFVQRVHSHLKAKTIHTMSIGYDILPGGAKLLDSGVRELSALRLWEISPVTFAMNPKATIDQVKMIARCTSVRELEDLLREAAGLSRTQAKLHAGAIWKTLSGQRDADASEEDAAQVVSNLVRHFSGANP